MLERLRQQKESLLGSKPSGTSSESSPVEDCVEKYFGCTVSLSYKERFLGCSFFFLLGFFLSFGSTFRLVKLLHGHPGPFATMYSIGNILSLFSTAFFVGPCKQLKTMFHKKRRISASLYLLFIIITLTVCFLPHIPGRIPLVMLCILIQFTALIWYSLSYIPYGRAICKSCLLRTCGCSNTTEDDLV